MTVVSDEACLRTSKHFYDNDRILHMEQLMYPLLCNIALSTSIALLSMFAAAPTPLHMPLHEGDGYRLNQDAGDTPLEGIAFERVIGGADRDRGVHVTTTRDSGFVAVGVTSSVGSGGEDVYLVRTDASGEVLWTRAYGGEMDDNGWAVQEAADGFFVAGFSQSFGAGGYDFYLIRTDAQGEVLWSKTYGGALDDRCWALAMTDDGGVVLAGETASSGAGERDYLLVKTDSSGNELWSRTFGGEKDDRCFAVALASDGGYVLAGQTFSEGAGDRDAWIVKTDANGERQWSQAFGGPESDVAHYVSATTDGMFFVTGYTTSFATSGDDPYIIKLSPDGEAVWTRVIPIAGVAHTITGVQASDGGFFCVGFVASSTGGRTALLIKTDADGHLQWQSAALGGTYSESMGYTVCATPDGGCIFTGHVVADRNHDLILVKVKSEEREPPRADGGRQM